MFYHVSTLDEELFGDVSSFSDWFLENEYSTGGETYRSWNRECNIAVKAGDVLGTAGGNPGQWMLDLGIYDTRYQPEMVANPARWSQYQCIHAVCPLQYYGENTMGTQLWNLVDREEIEGDSTPCGTVMQDVPGTAQGCWFLDGVSETYPEDPHLALVYSNTRPDRAVLSAGNSIPNLASGTYEFVPRKDGPLNRDFADITPDGYIYRFEVDRFDGVIIVSMPDASTLWIEALEGTTAGIVDRTFSDSKVVFVR
jgi:hypothetical protein